MAEATFNTPVARTAKAKATVESFGVNRSPAWATTVVSIRDASDNEIERLTFNVPDAAFPSATVVGFLTAIGTVRNGESGSVANKSNFRILGFFIDHNYITGASLAS
jgi:hypothetical protein